MTSTADGWANPETAAIATFLAASPDLAADLRETINSLAAEPTVDAGIEAAAAEVRGAVLGHLADVAANDVSETEATAVLLAVGGTERVAWSQLGELLLFQVVTGK